MDIRGQRVMDLETPSGREPEPEEPRNRFSGLDLGPVPDDGGNHNLKTAIDSNSEGS